MTTFQELKQMVTSSLGRDDNEALTIIKASINYAMTMAALLFEPPELCLESTITLTGGSNKLFFPYLVTKTDLDEEEFLGHFEIDANGDLMPIAGATLSTNLLDLIKVYNKTDGFKMDFIPYEQWDVVIPSSLTLTKYWTLFGETLIVTTTPSANIELNIGYTTYPKQLILDTDELAFSHLDGYIISSAAGIAFAVFEEQEASSLWAQIANLVGSPAAFGKKARAIIEGQKVLMEKAISEVG